MLIRRGSALTLFAAIALAGQVAAGPCAPCNGPLAPGTLVGWWDDRPLSEPGREARAPRVDADAWNGATRVAVAWEDRASGSGDIRLATSDDGGCSFTPRIVTQGPEDDRTPDVAISYFRDLLVVVFVRDLRAMVTASSDGGATFSAPETLAAAFAPADGAPRVAGVELGAGFHSHAVWTETGGTLRHAWSAAGGAAGTWSSGPPLSDSLAGFVVGPGADLEADTLSADPATLSAVTIALLAVAPGRSVSETFVLRSNDAGATFHGDPAVPATRDVPRRVSDDRPDDPVLGTSRVSLDGSDDGSGAFYVWTPVMWSDARSGSPAAFADARAEEGTGPTVVADWNDPPASGDVACGGPATSPAASLAVLPNPLDRPPNPELHVFVEGGGLPGPAREVSSVHGVLDKLALPSVTLFCTPYALTGVAPPRSSGEVVAASFSADEDPSHAFVVWADTREGAARIWWKRTDTQTEAPGSLAATPEPCASPDSRLRVTWTPPPQPPGCDVARTRVEWGTAPGAYTASIDVVSASAVTLSGLTEGQRIYLRATTVDEACNEASSSEISAVAPACGGLPLCPAPVGNTLLLARTPGDLPLVALVWTTPPVDATHGAATSYDVYRADVTPGSGYALRANEPLPGHLEPGVGTASTPPRLYYKIVSRNSCGTSGDEPPP